MPGGVFPDYELPDHTKTMRRLSELQGDDPLILTLARGHYCPKEHQQHLQLAAFYPQIAVAYTQIATISTDDHHTSQEFRASVGAQWPFLSDPERTVQRDLDIQEYTDPEHDPMIPHTLVLKPGLVIHSIYNGYWFWGRPSVEDLRQDLRAVTREIRPDWDLSTPGLREAWDAGDALGLPRLEQVEPGTGRGRARAGVGSGSFMCPASPALSASQLARLGELGEERTARVGEVLYRVGDRTYPFIAILEGEVEIVDAAGHEIIRHGPSGFLGEMNLLTGQTVFVTAVVTKPLRYVAVDRDTLRTLLFEDGPLSDLVLATLIERREALQQVDGIGLEIVGPHSSEPTMRMLEFARSNRLPYTWEDTSPPGEGELPLVRLPGGGELWGPSTGQVSRALGIGRELASREEVDLVVVGGGPAGLGAAVYGASEGLDTLVVESTALGGQAGSSRRIENYLGFPAGITRLGADEPSGHPGAQVQRAHRDARTAPSRWNRATGATSSGSRRVTRSPHVRFSSRRARSTGVLPSSGCRSSRD